MRIQNAEMEFVTFDAQDVIATSGPFTNQPLAATMKALDAYNDQIVDGTKFANKSGGWVVTDQATDDKYKENHWFVYDPANMTGKGNNVYHSTDRANSEKPNDPSYFYVSSGNFFDLISEWLEKQSIQ